MWSVAGCPVTAAVWGVRNRSAVGHHAHDFSEVEPVRVVGRALEHVDDAGHLPVEAIALSQVAFLLDQQFRQALGHRSESNE
jgi:hypothetical protein